MNIKTKNSIDLLLLGLLVVWWHNSSYAQTDNVKTYYGECTIGVAAGKATTDGRPLVWKTRDVQPDDQEAIYDTISKYRFLSIRTNRSGCSQGVNEKGFAIMNSTSSDLSAASSGMSNGEVMEYALKNCATIDEFEQFLQSTNSSGRRTATNLGVIDSTGAAAIFETAGEQFWKFDASDSLFAPEGYVLRTNFAFNGSAKYGLKNSIYSIQRYRRQVTLINEFYSGDSLNYKSILRTQMRDFSNDNSEPVDVPFQGYWPSSNRYGYIDCYKSICRSTSVSATVIQGVLPNERAILSTMWAMLGQPAAAITVPYWPVGKTPTAAYNSSKTAPLCDMALNIKAYLFDYPADDDYIDSYKLRDENGNGLWAYTFPAEDSILIAAQQKLDQWRQYLPPTNEILSEETNYANYALSILTQAYDKLMTSIQPEITSEIPSDFTLIQNYPNPFNAATTIEFSTPERAFITLKILNIQGQDVKTLFSKNVNAGSHSVNWHAGDVSSGIYFLYLYAEPMTGNKTKIYSQIKKLTLIK